MNIKNAAFEREGDRLKNLGGGWKSWKGKAERKGQTSSKLAGLHLPQVKIFKEKCSLVYAGSYALIFLAYCSRGTNNLFLFSFWVY